MERLLQRTGPRQNTQSRAVKAWLASQRVASMSCQAEVLSAGYALSGGAHLLKNELEVGSSLPHLLPHYIQTPITQTGQIAVACNRHHALE